MEDMMQPPLRLEQTINTEPSWSLGNTWSNWLPTYLHRHKDLHPCWVQSRSGGMQKGLSAKARELERRSVVLGNMDREANEEAAEGSGGEIIQSWRRRGETFNM